VKPIKVLVALAAEAPKEVGVKGKIEAREEEETLLLKVVQSVDVRRPRVLGPEDGRLKVRVPAEAVMPQSPLMAVVVVAKVMAVSVVLAQPEPSVAIPTALPQSLPVAETTPWLETWRHWVEVFPRPLTVRFVVEAVPRTARFPVVVAPPAIVRPPA
jgi:hypothetical protein